MEITAIKDIRGGMKNLNVIFIVLEVTASTKTKENRDVFSFKVSLINLLLQKLVALKLET